MKNDPIYAQLLGNIKTAVFTSQQKAAMAVNSLLLFTFRQVGNLILAEQEDQGWVTKVIDNLAADLSVAFLKTKVFARRKLINLQKFTSEWTEEQFVQQTTAQIIFINGLDK